MGCGFRYVQGNYHQMKLKLTYFIAFGPHMWPVYNVALFVLVQKYDPEG